MGSLHHPPWRNWVSVKKLVFPPGVQQGEAGRQACPEFKQPQATPPKGFSVVALGSWKGEGGAQTDQGHGQASGSGSPWEWAQPPPCPVGPPGRARPASRTIPASRVTRSWFSVVAWHPHRALAASRSLVDSALPTLAESALSQLPSMPLAPSSKRSEPRPPPSPQPLPGCWDKCGPGEAVLLLEKPAHTIADAQSRAARPAGCCD